MTLFSPFDTALKLVLELEGGFVNNPRDPGGPTFAGISLKAVVGLKLENGQLEYDLDGDGDVDVDDILELKRRYESGDHSLVENFFRERYWKLALCAALPFPLCVAHFDAAVNHGPAVAIMQLQKALRVDADGIVGPVTI